MDFALVQWISEKKKEMGFGVVFVAYYQLGLALVLQMFHLEKYQYYSQFGCFYHQLDFHMEYLSVNQQFCAYFS